MTCLLVTHEMGFAREIVDHIYFTDRGVIVEHGPPAAFYKEATDPRTREFPSQILKAAPRRGWPGDRRRSNHRQCIGDNACRLTEILRTRKIDCSGIRSGV